MKIVKTSAIALTLSAVLAGPVLAQSAASGTHAGGTAQQSGTMQQGGAAGADTELNAQAPGAKVGTGTATKGTVGSGNGGMARGTAGATGNAAPHAAPNGLDASGDPAAGTKRH